MRISRRNFHRLPQAKHKLVRHAQNFVEKTFADDSQTLKFAKVFPLESFPLYSISASLYSIIFFFFFFVALPLVLAVQLALLLQVFLSGQYLLFYLVFPSHRGDPAPTKQLNHSCIVVEQCDVMLRIYCKCVS